MRSPSAAELIRVWELGQGADNWYRGLLLLAPLFPARSLRDLSAITLGTRNAHLLALRARLFGPLLEAIVTCPKCAVRIEFSIAIQALLGSSPADCDSAYATRFVLDDDRTPIAYRLLCTDDLKEVADALPFQAATLLAERAVIAITGDSAERERLTAELADAMLTADPLADINLGIACEACGYEWSARFDIVIFLWHEIEAEVERLFDDVHRLGNAYGWSEAIILTMSSHRRRHYLERVS
jgi:hypothetical protein